MSPCTPVACYYVFLLNLYFLSGDITQVESTELKKLKKLRKKKLKEKGSLLVDICGFTSQLSMLELIKTEVYTINVENF